MMVALWAAVAWAGVVDRLAAVVNDDIVALSEIYELGGTFIDGRCPEPDDACILDAELEILDVQIRRILIRQELDRLGLQVTAADVDRAIDQTVLQYPNIEDRPALRAQVEASGQRWDQYRDELFEYLRNQSFQGRVLAPRVTMNDNEVQDRYQRETRKMKKDVALVTGFGLLLPEGVDAVPDPESPDPVPPSERDEVRGQAQALVDALNAGEIPWDDAVAKFDGAGVAAMFGQEVARGDLVEPLDRAVFEAEVGVVATPLELGAVLFILRVESRDERAEVVPFEEASEQIRNLLFQEKLVQAEEEWYQRARREAVIDIKLSE